MRAPWVFILAACSIVLLAGCTTQSAPASSVRVPGHATTPGTAHESDSKRVVAIHDGVVATATLQSPNDTTTGTLTVRYSSGNFTFALTNFTTSYPGKAMPALADTPESLGHCASYIAAFDDLPSGMTAPTTDKFMLDPSDLGSNDPSSLQTLLIVAYPTGKLVDGCDIPILATAPIRWTMPDTHPDLVAKDRGPHAAAEGTETLRDGVAFTYLVHSGDVWSAIAKRFGITGDDLAFLNPFSRGVDSETAYAGETLNLDKSHRGDSESRRFGTQ